MERKRSDNLCNCFILPLLNLNPTKLGATFVRSYLSKNLEYIIVEFKTAQSFEDHESYLTDFTRPTNNNTLVIFAVPPMFKETVLQFVRGQYSRFSEEAKSKIKRNSGLKYKVPIPGKKTKLSARELLALDKDPDLRKVWENELGVKIDSKQELMDLPSSANFMDFDLQTVYAQH